MFIYLSKKIAIPHNTLLTCLSWNQRDGYMAVGGDEGLLKILKLEPVGQEIGEVVSKSRGLAANSNLSMNQTLEGHRTDLRVLQWNEQFKKLTSSDQSGIIMVWMLYKGMWHEEMINNRKKSIVTGMAWCSEGQKICITYEDGAVILGTVDGQRIWGKEFKQLHITGVQWSPDDKFLLFSLKEGQCHLYDSLGNYIMKLEIKRHPELREMQIISLDWYSGKNGRPDPSSPVLAIIFQNGRVQLMRHENDSKFITLDTEMRVVCGRWNHNATMLAIAGQTLAHDEEKPFNAVQFYSPYGEHLRTLKIPGKTLTGCVWESSSLRIAMSVDSFIYFGNIRPDYLWCWFKRTIVFVTTKAQKSGLKIIFWDITTHQSHHQYLSQLYAIAGYGDLCVLATVSDLEEEGLGKYALMLCDAHGTVVDAKYTDYEVRWLAMNSSLVVAVSKDYVLLWHYKTPRLGMSYSSKTRLRVFHIDDRPSGAAEVMRDLDAAVDEPVKTGPSLDPACCVALSDKLLLVGRESGYVQKYSLPHVALIGRHKVGIRPHKLAVNSNSTRMSIIDSSGLLTLMDLVDQSDSEIDPEVARFERKDVWAICWAADNPNLFAVMEKTRMYIFRGVDPEEPIASAGYICYFQDLEIQTVLLDDVVDDPDNLTKDHIVKHEVKSLRDTKELLSKVGVAEAAQFIEDNPHPVLWRLLAEASLECFNLVTAESAFIRCKDYAGILFLKRLKAMGGETPIARAAVMAYLRRFDEAEAIYIENDRKDLALSMRRTLGDWFRVIQLIKTGARATDAELEQAFDAIGKHFAERCNWEAAKEYFQKSRNFEMLAKCYFSLEDYKSLEGMVNQLPMHSELLVKIAEMLKSGGVCSSAAEAYIRYGDVNAAITTCIGLNHWDKAISLAKKHNMPQVTNLLSKYATHLKQEDKLEEAHLLYYNAHKYIDAAEVLLEIVKRDKSLVLEPDVGKRIAVMGGLMVEDHYKSAAFPYREISITNADDHVRHLIWRAAEAFQLMALAMQYLCETEFHRCLAACNMLLSYTDVVAPLRVHCIMALAAMKDGCFCVASKAFTAINQLSEEELSPEMREKFEELAVDVFVKYERLDNNVVTEVCSECYSPTSDILPRCQSCRRKFPICFASARFIIGADRMRHCRVCRKAMLEEEVAHLSFCPICHSMFAPAWTRRAAELMACDLVPVRLLPESP